MKKSNFIHELYPQGTVLSFLFDKRRRKNRSLAWSVAIRREYWILHLSSSIPHLVVKKLSTKIEMFLADMQGWRGPRQTREIYCKTLIQWCKRTRPFFFKRVRLSSDFIVLRNFVIVALEMEYTMYHCSTEIFWYNTKFFLQNYCCNNR